MPEISGVTGARRSSLGRRLSAWSMSALTPMLATRCGLSSGRAVLMLIVAPMPPAGLLAWLVFHTFSDAIDSAARVATSHAREPEAAVSRIVVAGIWRPFNRIML